MSHLKPLGDRVVIKPKPRAEETASGIFIPDTAKEKPQEGTVISTGPGKLSELGKYSPVEVTEGQNILYNKYSGTEFKLDNIEYLILSEKDILAIVES